MSRSVKVEWLSVDHGYELAQIDPIIPWCSKPSPAPLTETQNLCTIRSVASAGSKGNASVFEPEISQSLP
jgi:hypothetical protein